MSRYEVIITRRTEVIAVDAIDAAKTALDETRHSADAPEVKIEVRYLDESRD